MTLLSHGAAGARDAHAQLARPFAAAAAGGRHGHRDAERHADVLDVERAQRHARAVDLGLERRDTRVVGSRCSALVVATRVAAAAVAGRIARALYGMTETTSAGGVERGRFSSLRR